VFILTITPKQVQKAYSGKQGCMCGCKGKYSINPAHKAEADVERGYEMPAARNLAQIKKVLRTLQNDPRVTLQNGYIVHLAKSDPDERNYVVYLCKSARI
jgi:xanthine dehydrogenase iron-sulfur cluster and FAD-binding subunit A